MVAEGPDNNPYLVLQRMPEYWAVTLTTRRGMGRAARRELVDLVRVPYVPREAFTDVLRRVADALDTPRTERWLPHAGGPGSP